MINRNFIKTGTLVFVVFRIEYLLLILNDNMDEESE